jgi:16S rRNA processing protein RimM
LTDKGFSAGKLAIGKIVKGHGLKGYLKVISYSGESKHFLDLKEVYLLKKQEFFTYRIEDVKRDKKNILIKLEGIDTLTEALKFILFEVWANREHAAPLKKGEFYLADLNECKVYQQDRLIGQVNAILSGGRLEMLEIINSQGRTVILPLDAHFIKDINIEEKQIRIEEI